MINLGTNSGKGLPNIRLPRTLLTTVLEAMNVLLLFAMWFFVIYYYNTADAPKDIGSLLMLGFSQTIATGLALGISYFPLSSFNFPVKVTEANVVRQYKLATHFVRVLVLFIGGSLFIPMLQIAGYLHQIRLDMGVITLSVMFIPLVIYFILAYLFR